MAAVRRAVLWPRAMLVALQFLTRLPVRIEPPPEAREVGLSLACYPLVGLVLGVALWGIAAERRKIVAARQHQSGDIRRAEDI